MQSHGPVGIRTRGLPRARRAIYQTDLRALPDGSYLYFL